MDREIVTLNIELLSTYISQERLALIEREMIKSIQKAIAKIDPDYAPVLVEVTKVECA